ncbi:hypothetical protein [Pseudomonas sp.]|uniref:hypothetical protein n=1 Tax=Pseudomonas sp. TaxID=306 RepID=UPI003C721697
MKNAFEEIRAERERPLQSGNPRAQYAGLWKQIALGIVIGYTALGVLGFIAWTVATKFMLSNLQLIAP